MDIGGDLIAYVGGLDMTSGRYDDQDHPLFRQSTADDETDYYQYTIAKPEYGVYVASQNDLTNEAKRAMCIVLIFMQIIEDVLSLAAVAYLCRDPREPWHDIHMRLTNKGALDIYNNFKDRLMKEQDEGTKYANDVELYDVEGLPKLTGACPSTTAWHTQVHTCNVDGDMCSVVACLHESVDVTVGRWRSFWMPYGDER